MQNLGECVKENKLNEKSKYVLIADNKVFNGYKNLTDLLSDMICGLISIVENNTNSKKECIETLNTVADIIKKEGKDLK